MYRSLRFRRFAKYRGRLCPANRGTSKLCYVLVNARFVGSATVQVVIQNQFESRIPIIARYTALVGFDALTSPEFQSWVIRRTADAGVRAIATNRRDRGEELRVFANCLCQIAGARLLRYGYGIHRRQSRSRNHANQTWYLADTSCKLLDSVIQFDSANAMRPAACSRSTSSAHARGLPFD